MKSTIVKTMLLVSAFAVSGFAETVTIQVPFEFSAAGKTLPAGEYRFQEETSGVMVITSVAMIAVARFYWAWGLLRIALLWGTLTAVNAAFLLASTLKFLEGGFIPLTIGILLFVVMATWRWGRRS